MKRRSGMTLIEMLVVISLLAVILPLAGRLTYLLLRAQAASADSLSDAMILTRFSQSFRNDVHAARSAERPKTDSAADAPLLLTLDSRRRVTYARDPTGLITRTQSDGQRVARREQFRMTGIQTRFEIEAGGRSVAAVHGARPIVRAGTAAVAGPSVIRVEAVLGRDRRFEQTLSKSQSLEPPPPSLPENASIGGKRR